MSMGLGVGYFGGEFSSEELAKAADRPPLELSIMSPELLRFFENWTCSFFWYTVHISSYRLINKIGMEV